MHAPDILDCLANLSNDEVFTPPTVANMILDTLPADVWCNPHLKFLDPAVKSGVFLRECAVRLMAGLADTIPNEGARRDHIFKNMLYGIAITDLTALLARRTVYYSKFANADHAVVQFMQAQGNIFYDNIPHEFMNGKCTHCGTAFDRARDGDNNKMDRHAYQFIHQNIQKIMEQNMKFDVIIGNPPYQLETNGFGRQASPIYHKFIENALKLNPRYLSFIIPARWYSGGMGLDDFRDMMLQNRHLRKIFDYPNASDCFAGVEIKGGVCYFLHDSDYDGDCEFKRKRGGGGTQSQDWRDLREFPVLIRFAKGIDIIRKVKQKQVKCYDEVVMGIDPFQFPTNFEDYEQDYFPNAVQLYGNKFVGWVARNKITKNTHLVDQYKVLLAKAAEGSGEFPNRILGKPIIAEPNSACTFTYLVIQSFHSREQAENCVAYIKTKFFRFMVALLKSTQDVNRGKFAFAPVMDLNQQWSDEKLYDYFALSPDERAFIDEIVKQME